LGKKAKWTIQVQILIKIKLKKWYVSKKKTYLEALNRRQPEGKETRSSYQWVLTQVSLKTPF
jgi:hypothetical protein